MGLVGGRAAVFHPREDSSRRESAAALAWDGGRVALPSPAQRATQRALPGPEQHENEGSLINKGFLLCCGEVCSYQPGWQFSKTEMTVVGCKRDNCQISWDISPPRFSISCLS